MKQTVKAWQVEHVGETVGKKDFPGLLKKAWGKVATFENASHGFRKSGIYPLSITCIDSTKLGPSQIEEKVKEHNILTAELAISKKQPERENGVQGEETRASVDITDSGDKIVESISKTPSNKQETVAPAFQKLFVPCPKEKRKVDRIGERLPKAISGARAIEMLKERENKKRQEEEAKAKQKGERLQKKIQNEEEKERKKIAREEKRNVKAESTASKNSSSRKKRKAKHDESDSENEIDSKLLCDDESDDTMEEFDMCPVCNKGDQHPSCWVRCEICNIRWHFMCADRPEYELLDEDERKNCEFVCPMFQ